MELLKKQNKKNFDFFKSKNDKYIFEQYLNNFTQIKNIKSLLSYCLIIEFKNNKIYVVDIAKKYNIDLESERKAYINERIESVIQMLKFLEIWIEKKQKKIKNGFVILNMGEHENILLFKYIFFPFLFFAKFSESRQFLIPNFQYFSFPKEMCESFSEYTIIDYIKDIKGCIPKYNKIYFVGRNTSDKTTERTTDKTINFENSLIREYIDEHKDKNFFFVLNNGTKYKISQNLTESCKFKYLLDLPGVYPWSVRSPFLFLTNSVVFKVNEIHNYINKSYKNETLTWENIFFEKNIDYINIDFEFILTPKESDCFILEKIEDFNKKSRKKVVKEIKEKYTELNKDEKKYNQIRDNMVKKAKAVLNPDFVLEGLYETFKTYLKLNVII